MRSKTIKHLTDNIVEDCHDSGIADYFSSKKKYIATLKLKDFVPKMPLTERRHKPEDGDNCNVSEKGLVSR